MSILSALTDTRTMNFEQAFGAKNITSAEMQQAINKWLALYLEGNEAEGHDDCQRLPVVIVNKVTKTAFSELSTSVDASGNKADFMRGLLDEIDAVKKQVMQYALVGGECLVKPVIAPTGFIFVPIRRDCIMPLGRDAKGGLIDVGTAESTTHNGKYFTLLERRTVDAGGTLTIQSKLYMSFTKGELGTEVSLATLDRYAHIEPVIALAGVGSLGMAHIKTPLLNCVDMSYDGVSVYAPAVKLMDNINRNEQQINDEFEHGKSRIIASADLLRKDRRGRRTMDDDIFVSLDDDPESVGITIFSPALREQSYLARKQEYLRNIESQIGLKRGILSDVEAVERTATEITSSAGDYNLTIQDFQHMFEVGVRDLLSICDKLGQIYKLCDGSKFDHDAIVIDWGDGVLYNRDKSWQEISGMVQAGLIKPEIAIAWYYSVPFPQSEQDLAGIRAKYMPEIGQLVGE